MLVFDISSEDRFINTHGGSEVAPGPEGFLFVEAMETLDLLLHPGAALALQELEGVGDGVSGGEDDEEMDVVLLDGKVQDFPMFPFGNGFKDSPQFILHLLVPQDLATVLGSPHNVVL